MGTSRARHKGVTSYYLILPDAISFFIQVNYMSQRVISVPRSIPGIRAMIINMVTSAAVTRLDTSHIVTIMIIIR